MVLSRRLFLINRSAAATARSPTSWRSSWQARRMSDPSALASEREASARGVHRAAARRPLLERRSWIACASAWAAWILAVLLPLLLRLGASGLGLVERLLDGLRPLVHLGQQGAVQELGQDEQEQEKVDGLDDERLVQVDEPPFPSGGRGGGGQQSNQERNNPDDSAHREFSGYEAV